MSHYSLYVITPAQPQPGELEALLQPYHEFACTGTEDQYVQTIAITDEARQAYADDTTRRFKAPDGSLHYPYQDHFYREFTDEELRGKPRHYYTGTGGSGTLSWTSKDWGDGRGYRSKAHQLPPGWESVELPTPQVQDFRSWVDDYYGYEAVLQGTPPDLTRRHKHGYAVVDSAGTVVAVYKRHNPNSKWDWWQLGGRWSGHLRVLPGHTPAALGRNSGAGGETPEHEHPLAADQLAAGTADLAGLRAEGYQRGCQLWDRATAALQPHPAPVLFSTLWDQAKAALPAGQLPDRDAIWAQVEAQPGYAALKAEVGLWDLPDALELAGGTREAAGQQYALQATSAFAYLRDGQWHARGEMGWWGTVSGEQQSDHPQEWECHVNGMLDGLPQDAWISVVDCHT